jgi:hypothetical protein
MHFGIQVLKEIYWLTVSSVTISPVKAAVDWSCVYKFIAINIVMLIRCIFFISYFKKTNKTHKLEYNKIDHKIQFISGAISYTFRHQCAIIISNFCYWKSPWWWNLGAEICRWWNLIWSVFGDLFHCELVHFVGF